MRLIFYLPKILFFYIDDSSLGQLHTNGDTVPTFGRNAGSLHRCVAAQGNYFEGEKYNVWCTNGNISVRIILPIGWDDGGKIGKR